jgi:phosphatidylserine/phosphatidylglycerophosphate/cardiolipin synthase-like enzyme
MRLTDRKNGLKGNVIAGTHVVFFGLDLAQQKRTGFRGFAFQRKDHLEDETIWLRGMKTFELTEPHPARGETFSTRYHPVQGFQWCDYSVKPGRRYTYRIVALYGEPDALTEGPELEFTIDTETEAGAIHSAFFNRGSVATQEYARRFENQKPSDAGPGAYEWLSRGLLEALLEFLERAQAGWEIHAAVYEFQWPAVLAAVRQAHLRGAKVHVIYDDIEAYTPEGKADGPWEKNREAIDEAKIKSLCRGRTNGTLMHNKFFVLSQDGTPKAVWTGSTNLTENGIYGHSNLGHIVEDERVARAFRDYWDRLYDDVGVADMRGPNIAAISTPPNPWGAGTTAVFSPRGTDLDALTWYADIAAGARDGLLMTFAFGMHGKFQEVYSKDDDVLRMALMEKDYGNPKTKDKDQEAIRKIRNRPNVLVAIGNRIVTNSFDRWLKEMAKAVPSAHVYWIHTKYMLVDPLGDEPIVVSGSANFSKASTDTNDENMLVIRGNKRIADIYFGEYMRLYAHYAFRESVKRYLDRKKSGAAVDEWKPQFLETEDSWMADYFDPDDSSARYARRRYFSGEIAL